MNKEQEKIMKALEAIKPFLSLSDDMKRAHNELVKRYKAIEAEKTKPRPIEKVSVGDIFISIWGYEQSNVEFYQVTRKTKSTIALRRVRNEIVEKGEFYDSVMPNVDYPSEESITRKKVFDNDDFISIKLSSFKSAMLWNGKSAKQTAFGRGH